MATPSYTHTHTHSTFLGNWDVNSPEMKFNTSGSSGDEEWMQLNSALQSNCVHERHVLVTQLTIERNFSDETISFSAFNFQLRSFDNDSRRSHSHTRTRTEWMTFTNGQQSRTNSIKINCNSPNVQCAHSIDLCDAIASGQLSVCQHGQRVWRDHIYWIERNGSKHSDHYFVGHKINNVWSYNRTVVACVWHSMSAQPSKQTSNNFQYLFWFLVPQIFV